MRFLCMERPSSLSLCCLLRSYHRAVKHFSHLDSASQTKDLLLFSFSFCFLTCKSSRHVKTLSVNELEKMRNVKCGHHGAPLNEQTFGIFFPPIYSVYLDFNTKSMITKRPKPTLRWAVMDVTAKLWNVFKPSDVSSFVTQELFLTVEKCFLLCNFHLKQTKHPICWHSWYAYIYYSSYSHTVIILKWCFDLIKKKL